MRKRSIWEWVFLKMGKRSPENEAVQKFRKWRDTKWRGVGWAGALFHQPQNCQKYFPAHKFIFSAATRRFLYLDPSFLHHPVTICLNKAARLTPQLFAKKIQKQSYEKLYFNHPNILGHFWIDRLPPNRHPLGRDCHIPTDQHMLSIATSSLVDGKMATGQKSLKSHRLQLASFSVCQFDNPCLQVHHYLRPQWHGDTQEERCWTSFAILAMSLSMVFSTA